MGYSIVDRFEAAVVQYSDLTALEDSSGRRLTYDGLNRKANGIAHLLQDRLLNGPVALMFDDAILSVSSIFGVLKTGNMFVFINPSFPAERISGIVNDLNPGLVLTETKYVSSLSLLSTVPVLDVESAHFDEDPQNLGVVIPPDSPAYAIYTSGSMGVPKGVVFTHSMVLHDNQYVISDAGITPSDRFGMLTSLSFVASRAGLYGALLSGAALCMFDPLTSSPSAIALWLDTAHISILYTTPSLFRTIFSSVDASHVFDSLRVLHLAGEKTTPAEVKLFRQHCKDDGLLLVIYGQTETGRVARFPIHRDTVWNEPVIPVGYLVPDKEVLILNEDGNPLGPGEVGDIVVRSRFIPSGYLLGNVQPGYKQDDRDHNLQIFATGDVGRLTEDGALVYLGRKDDQVKINGQRVEPGEVETVLRLHEDVEFAMVIARPDIKHDGQVKLVAYILQKPDGQLTTRALRDHLSMHLPMFMIPSNFVFLSSIPLSAHGKVDLRSLPDPQEMRSTHVPDHPANDVEERLLAVWKKTFQIDTIGVNDDFFDLGGDSLLAMSLFLDIESAFGSRMPITIILKASTIRQQAELLVNLNSLKASPVIPVKISGRKPPIFWIPSGFGVDLYVQGIAQYLDPEQPLFLLAAPDAQNKFYLLEELGRLYAEQIREFQPSGPYFLLGHSNGGILACATANALLAGHSQIGWVGMLDTIPPHSAGLSTLVAFRLFFTNIKALGFWRALKDLNRNLLVLTYTALYSIKWIERYIHKKRKIPFPGLLGTRASAYARVIFANHFYNPTPFPFDLILFRAKGPQRYSVGDIVNGWKRYIAKNFTVVDVSGDHVSIMEAPYVAELARVICRQMKNTAP
jgi:amino acid adenylation domain-containing protein